MKLSSNVYIMNKKLIWSFQKKVRKEMLDCLWVNFVEPDKEISSEKDWKEFCDKFVHEFESTENNADSSSQKSFLCYMNVNNHKLFGSSKIAFRIQENGNQLQTIFDINNKLWQLNYCGVENGKYVNCTKEQMQELFNMSLRKDYCLIPIIDTLDMRFALLRQIQHIRDKCNLPYEIPGMA